MRPDYYLFFKIWPFVHTLTSSPKWQWVRPLTESKHWNTHRRNWNMLYFYTQPTCFTDYFVIRSAGTCSLPKDWLNPVSLWRNLLQWILWLLLLDFTLEIKLVINITLIVNDIVLITALLVYEYLPLYLSQFETINSASIFRYTSCDIRS